MDRLGRRPWGQGGKGVMRCPKCF